MLQVYYVEGGSNKIEIDTCISIDSIKQIMLLVKSDILKGADVPNAESLVIHNDTTMKLVKVKRHQPWGDERCDVFILKEPLKTSAKDELCPTRLTFTLCEKFSGVKTVKLFIQGDQLT